MTLIVLGAGGLGCAVAALLSEDKDYVLPTRAVGATGTVYRPGWVGLIVTGAVGAWLAWGLYGPVASASVSDSGDYALTMSTICGAVLVGTGGSKWMSSQIDKRLLQQAAGTAALANSATTTQAQTIATGSPMEALGTARTMIGIVDPPMKQPRPVTQPTPPPA